MGSGTQTGDKQLEYCGKTDIYHISNKKNCIKRHAHAKNIDKTRHSF